MYTDSTGCAPQWLGWLFTGIILAGLAVATVLTFGAAAPITGLAATIVVGAMIGATVGFGASIISQGISNGWDNINSWQVLFDTGMGAVTGAIGGSGIGKAGSMIVGGVLGFGGSIAGDAIAGKDINWGKAVIMGIVGVGLGAWSGAGAGNAKAMSSSINAGKSWGAKTFMNFGVSVADRGATQLARQTAALFFANAVLGYQAQALVKVTAAYLGSYITGSVLGGI